MDIRSGSYGNLSFDGRDRDVLLTRAERKQGDEYFESLKHLPADVLHTIRAGLSREIRHLVEVMEWAEGETEQTRAERHERAILTYYAVQLAFTFAANREYRERRETERAAAAVKAVEARKVAAVEVEAADLRVGDRALWKADHTLSGTVAEPPIPCPDRGKGCSDVCFLVVYERPPAENWAEHEAGLVLVERGKTTRADGKTHEVTA